MHVPLAGGLILQLLYSPVGNRNSLSETKQYFLTGWTPHGVPTTWASALLPFPCHFNVAHCDGQMLCTPIRSMITLSYLHAHPAWHNSARFPTNRYNYILAALMSTMMRRPEKLQRIQ